jgi:pheromone shutdown protein TraB
MIVFVVRTIYVIGTAHTMMPQREMELKLLLQVVDPDEVFVQIDDEDMKYGNLHLSPKEMVFAHKWAAQRNKKVVCFDKRMDVGSFFLNDEKKKEVRDEMAHLIAGTNWKEFNRINSDVYKKFDRLKLLLVDENKERERHYAMLANIERELIGKGKILVLVGIGHLPFFERNLKDALFPLGR